MARLHAGIGFAAGLLGGLLGVGGGFLMVPLQMMLARTGLPDANANSLAAVVPISVAGALVYYFGGSRPAVNLPFAGLLMLGGALGAFAGARLTQWIPEGRLRQLVVVVLVLLGLKEMILP